MGSVLTSNHWCDGGTRAIRKSTERVSGDEGGGLRENLTIVRGETRHPTDKGTEESFVTRRSSVPDTDEVRSLDRLHRKM